MSWLGLIFGLSLITPAMAGNAPLFLPAHDVAADYVLAVPGRADANYRLQYDAADQRARIFDPLRGIAFVVDLPAGRAALVVPALRAVVDAPDISDLARQVEHADGARFLPLGPGHYAGLDCDNYEVITAQGSGKACITPDGIILHFAGRDARGSASVTAVSVAYGPQRPADFVVPDTYSRIHLPPGALAQLLGQ